MAPQMNTKSTGTRSSSSTQASAAGDSAGGGKDTGPQVDFGKLDIGALKRYKRHYKLRTKHNSTKTELMGTIARHFSGQPVLEMETISYFVYAVKNQDKLLKLKPSSSLSAEA